MRELFAHLRDPAIVIRRDSITFNTACITGLEDVVYVHVMFNSDLKRIVVRGCDENDKDALRWCIAKPDKRKSRKMSCKPFAELVYKEMGWDSECRYKMLGYRISFEGETLYVFDLLVPEIFHESQKRKKGATQNATQETKPADTRKGFYPDDIAGTFGVPVEEHLKENEIKQIDGYASSWITEEKLLYDWAEYIKICKKIGWNDYFPERFITKYNEALEMAGLSPIIYGFHSKSWLLHLDRERNKISCMGNFPCDGLGRPIMKWIGIRTEKVEGVSCTCVNSRYGELIIQINPESMIYVLNYVDGNGELAEPGEAGTVISWEQQYAGPLNMVFDNEALKEARKAFKMTQKELADAIGTSVA